MKKSVLFSFFLFLAMWQTAKAGQDSDLVWSKDFYPDNISDIKFYPLSNDNRVIIAGTTGIYIFNSLTGTLIHRIPVYNEVPYKIILTSDGRYFYASTLGSIITKYDANTYLPLDTLLTLGPKNISVNGVDITPDGTKLIFTCHTYGKPNVDSNIVVVSTDKLIVEKIYSSTIQVGGVTIFPGGTRFILAVGRNFEIWDINTFKKLASLDTIGANDDINCMKFSPDGKLLGVSLGGNIKIYGMENFSLKKYISCLKNSDCPNWQLTFSNDSRYLIYGAGTPLDNNETTKVYDIQNNEYTYLYPKPYCAAYGIDIDKSSKYLAIGITNNFYLLNLKFNQIGVPGEKTTAIIEQIYPNPTNGDVSISYTLPQNGLTIVNLIDGSAQYVLKIFEGLQVQGINILSFNTKLFAAGLYFVKVQSGSYAKIFKLIIER